MGLLCRRVVKSHRRSILTRSRHPQRWSGSRKDPSKGTHEPNKAGRRGPGGAEGHVSRGEWRGCGRGLGPVGCVGGTAQGDHRQDHPRREGRDAAASVEGRAGDVGAGAACSYSAGKGRHKASWKGTRLAGRPWGMLLAHLVISCNSIGADGASTWMHAPSSLRGAQWHCDILPPIQGTKPYPLDQLHVRSCECVLDVSCNSLACCGLWSCALRAKSFCGLGDIMLDKCSHSILMLADLSFMVCSASLLACAHGPCVRAKRGSRDVARPGRLPC